MCVVVVVVIVVVVVDVVVVVVVAWSLETSRFLTDSFETTYSSNTVFRRLCWGNYSKIYDVCPNTYLLNTLLLE